MLSEKTETELPHFTLKGSRSRSKGKQSPEDHYLRWFLGSRKLPTSGETVSHFRTVHLIGREMGCGNSSWFQLLRWLLLHLGRAKEVHVGSGKSNQYAMKWPGLRSYGWWTHPQCAVSARPERPEDEVKIRTRRKEKETGSESTDSEGRHLKQGMGGGFEHSHSLEHWQNRTVNCVELLPTIGTLNFATFLAFEEQLLFFLLTLDSEQTKTAFPLLETVVLKTWNENKAKRPHLCLLLAWCDPSVPVEEDFSRKTSITCTHSEVAFR